jgi:tetratricopeptide (TPR) repeat protein
VKEQSSSRKQTPSTQSLPVLQQTTQVPPATAEQDKDTATDLRRFFRIEDWIVAALTTLISGLAFFYYMAPEVTLQDSGELVTGAFTFGVPHPPGYPLWAFIGFLWSHFIVPFGNPAWRICLLSVVTGAFTVGVLCITMTRSIRLLLHSLPWRDAVDADIQRWIALAIGASTSLLFGFNRGVWLWACVSEMRVLNQFSFVLTTCTFFAWMMQPHRRGFLYTTLVLFGLSLANHQTIGIMVIPFGIGTLAICLENFFEVWPRARGKESKLRTLMTSLAGFWELSAAGLLGGMVMLFVFAWLPSQDYNTFLKQGFAAGGAGIFLLIIGLISGWWQVRRALACVGFFLAGVSFYLFMPIAASTNPPMNWGFASTKEGFLHAITRGQYEKLQTAHVFSEEFFLKVKVFTLALVNQYSLAVVLLGLVTFVVMAVWWRRVNPRCRAWLVFVCTAFLATSLGLLTIINPKLDRQEQEITIKFFAPAHGFYAMLIGFSIAILLSMLAWRMRDRSGIMVRVLCVGLLALPLVTFKRNWSLCNLRGHDFGYLFGYLMFEPGGGYPPMDRDAVLYGGTDPGRFVPTYMIFCESRVRPNDRFRNKDFDRSDVYIITQNALADSTYMCYIRDHYDYSRPDLNKPETIEKFLPWQRLVFRLGWTWLNRAHTYPPEPIYIPSQQDTAMAFQQYVTEVQEGKRPANAEMKIEGGRVQVSGATGVMEINGILAQWIFERNKDKHAFYVEESYVIPWMYPYLRPHGVIMKIEKEPLQSPQENDQLWKEIIGRDRAYWDKLTDQFLAREDFRRNNDAKKSFSKMRSAIAGLYQSRGLLGEAEYAFKQSLRLCPESPEANFRLADMYMGMHRYAEAQTLMEEYQKLDIYNASPTAFLNNVKNINAADARRQEIEKQIAQAQGRMDINMAIELSSLYLRLGMIGMFQELTRNVMSSTNLPPNVYMAIGQLCNSARQWDMMDTALRRYLQSSPSEFRAWIEVAYAKLMQNKPDDSMAALKQALRTGGEGARAIFREDPRFFALRQKPEFQKLALPPPQLNTLPTSFESGM